MIIEIVAAKMKLTLPAGLEPATYRLTADRSANWAMEADMLILLIIHTRVMNLYVTLESIRLARCVCISVWSYKK